MVLSMVSIDIRLLLKLVTYQHRCGVAANEYFSEICLSEAMGAANVAAIAKYFCDHVTM